jgi:hypothetical protein
MALSSALAGLNPLHLFRGRKATQSAGAKSTVQTALYQRSDPPRRDTAQFMAAWDKLPWMRAVVEKIAYAEASVRWTVSGVRNSKGLITKTGLGKISDPVARRKALANADVQPFEDHPLVDLLADPNPVLTPLEVSMLLTAFDLVGGDAFIVLESAPPGPIPTMMWPFPPHWCRWTPTVERPTFQFDNGLGMRREFQMNEVLWMRGMNLTNPYGRSKGIYQTMEDELSSYENASELVNYQFYNRNRPDLIVSLEGASEDQVTALEDRFKGRFEGISQMFRSLITNAKLKVEKIPADFVHSQLIELLAFMRDAQMQVPGVPKEIMAVTETSNRATITAAVGIFWEQLVVPRLEKKREFLQKHLVPIYDDRAILDYDNPVPEDKDFALSALNGGKVVVRVNEPRKLMGLEPLPPEEGGDLFMVPQGVSLKTKLEESTPPALLPFTGGRPPAPRLTADEPTPVGDVGATGAGGQSVEPGAGAPAGVAKTARPTQAGGSPAARKTDVMRALGLA